MEHIGSRPDWQCKVVLIGDSNVGKTCLMRRYTDNEFSTNFVSTIGIDFKIKMVKVKDRLIKVQIWDTAGQEKFRSITTAYYRGAKGIFVIYDVTNHKSFENISSWMKNISRWACDAVECMILGNKCDDESRREVNKHDGEKVARNSQVTFMETSAKNDVNVEEAFRVMLTKIVEKNSDVIRQKLEARFMEEIDLNENSIENKDTTSNKKCCK